MILHRWYISPEGHNSIRDKGDNGTTINRNKSIDSLARGKKAGVPPSVNFNFIVQGDFTQIGKNTNFFVNSYYADILLFLDFNGPYH